MASTLTMTPAEAIEFLRGCVEYLANPLLDCNKKEANSFPQIQQMAVGGWNKVAGGWQSNSKWHQEYVSRKSTSGYGSTPGILSGATKKLMTLQDGTFFLASPWGLYILGPRNAEQGAAMGMELSASEMTARRAMGGGTGDAKYNFPGKKHTDLGPGWGEPWQAPLRHTTTQLKSTGRNFKQDNRISPRWNIGEVYGLDRALPENLGADLKAAKNRLSWTNLRRARRGQLCWRVVNGRPVKQKYDRANKIWH